MYIYTYKCYHAEIILLINLFCYLGAIIWTNKYPIDYEKCR